MTVNNRFEIHAHTHYSNVKFVDSINKPKELIDRAVSIGLRGICITDHSCIGAHVEANQYVQELNEKYPYFKVGLGEESYLCQNRDKEQYYYHQIFIAKNAVGHKMIRELSSISWESGYYDRGIFRTPILYTEMEDIISKYGKGNLIASSACLAGTANHNLLLMIQAEQANNTEERKKHHHAIVEYIKWMKEWFGDDFYLEVAPGFSADQILVNNRMPSLAKVFGIKMVIGTDSHYLSKKEQNAHRVFLNSKSSSDREVDDFYADAFLQDENDILERLNNTTLNYKELCENSMEIYDKIECYSLFHSQQVPQVEVKTYPKINANTGYEILDNLYSSDDAQERYWVNQCVEELERRGLKNDTYMSRLEEEAEVHDVVGKRLNTCMFSYPVFLQHYIDLIWETGSTVGAGRGCFVPGTKVLLEDGTEKAIEKVVTGDRVRTIDGTAQDVVNRFEYEADEYMYTVTSSTTTFAPVTSTNNHEFWGMREKKCTRDRAWCSKNCSRQCKTRLGLTKEWIAAEDLKVGDYLFYPRVKFGEKKKNNIDLCNYIQDKSHYVVTDSEIAGQYGKGKPFSRFIQIDKNLLYLIGVAIGDGWTICEPKKGGKFGIAFNSATQKDIDSMNRCISILESYGFATAQRKHKSKNLIQVYVYNVVFTNMMRSLIGDGVENKRIPDIAMYDNRDDMIELMRGLLASDGSYDSSTTRISYDGINYNLISQVKMLWSYIGVYGTISRRKANGNNKEGYKLRAGGAQLIPLYESFPLINRSSTGVKKEIIVDEDGFYFKVKEISKEKYTGKVYDLHVNNNHNYIVNQLTVHNSACSGLSHFLLGVTQLDPVKNNLPFWRYMNRATEGLGDIDIDVCPSMREKIFKNIRKERGDLGCVQVCTYGTVGSRSAVLNACRGYRSVKYPNGINNDDAQYISSLISSERGFTYTISDMVDGNAEKDRKPNKEFINAINEYPGLMEVVRSIEGVIDHVGVHASGVLFENPNNPYQKTAFMRAPSGCLVTQYSLHAAEYMGCVKFDILVTDVQDIIVQCLHILQEHGQIEQGLTLRQMYDKYIHPDKLPIEDEKLWDDIDAGKILKFFQFEEETGKHTLQLLKPRNPVELANCNSVMRLMAQEKGGETPSDRYYRMKNDMRQWYDEMEKYGLTVEEQKVLEKYYLPAYATPAQQEDLMMVLMDKDICNFSLTEGNAARKICSKKKMDKIESLHKQVMEKAKSENLGKYVWDTTIKNQLGYSFSLIHSLSYSYVGIQTAYLATYFNPIYWNAACLRVMSGLEDDASANYNKIAKAVSIVQKRDIDVATININKSSYFFEPDEETNSILYGMKGLTSINGEAIHDIIANRPYTSFSDFNNKVKLSKVAVLNLIKSGAFDEFGTRVEVMTEYLAVQSNPKTKLTLSNLNALFDQGIVPPEFKFEKRVFVFNKALKANCKDGESFIVEGRYYDFYAKFFDVDQLVNDGGVLKVSAKTWKKQYDKALAGLKKYITDNQSTLLEQFNGTLFNEQWDKYASGNVSKWEMDSMGFYAGKHELGDIPYASWGVSNFDMLPEEPVKIEGAKGRYSSFKLSKIVGTVIAKNDMKSTFTLLTPDAGPVDVRMSREMYARYNQRISKVNEDGTKSVLEEGWFSRGTLLMVTGFRRGTVFTAKTYRNTPSAPLYRIFDVEGPVMSLTDRRANDTLEYYGY